MHKVLFVALTLAVALSTSFAMEGGNDKPANVVHPDGKIKDHFVVDGNVAVNPPSKKTYIVVPTSVTPQVKDDKVKVKFIPALPGSKKRVETAKLDTSKLKPATIVGAKEKTGPLHPAKILPVKIVDQQKKGLHSVKTVTLSYSTPTVVGKLHKKILAGMKQANKNLKKGLKSAAFKAALAAANKAEARVRKLKALAAKAGAGEKADPSTKMAIVKTLKAEVAQLEKENTDLRARLAIAKLSQAKGKITQADVKTSKPVVAKTTNPATVKAVKAAAKAAVKTAVHFAKAAAKKGPVQAKAAKKVEKKAVKAAAKAVAKAVAPAVANCTVVCKASKDPKCAADCHAKNCKSLCKATEKQCPAMVAACVKDPKFFEQKAAPKKTMFLDWTNGPVTTEAEADVHQAGAMNAVPLNGVVEADYNPSADSVMTDESTRLLLAANERLATKLSEMF